MTQTGRERLLLDTAAAVRARGRNYGPPEEHFARTCGAANAILGDLFRRPITPEDWARLMILDKLARDAEKPIPDNSRDIAGYAACLAEVRGYGGEDRVSAAGASEGSEGGETRGTPQAAFYASSGVLVGEDEG